VGDEGVAETDAAGGEAVHGWRFEPRVAGLFAVFFRNRTHRIPAMVVGDDEDEVGFAFGGLQDRGGSQQNEE